MLALRSLKTYARSIKPRNISRAFSSLPPTGQNAPSSLPWFMDPADLKPTPSTRQPKAAPVTPSFTNQIPVAPLPSDIPSTSIIAQLHKALQTSPHLEPGQLLIREPIPTVPGPRLPAALPRGRRKRGGTYFGEGLSESFGTPNIWNWIVLAQVKEGTEKRGGIEAVYRLVRKTLLTATPPLPLPPNHKRRVHNGWAMIDVGDFAVHIVGKEARERYFPEIREW